MHDQRAGERLPEGDDDATPASPATISASAAGPGRATRDRLLDAAIDALSALSAADLITAIGTREIAKRAGVSAATLYHHFGSVAEFAQSLVERVFDPGPAPAQITAERLDAVRGSPLPVDTEYAFHDAEFARLTDSTQLPLRIALSILGGPAAAAAYRTCLAAMEDRLAAVLDGLVESWGREPRPPFDIATLTTTHMALVHGMVQRHRLDPARVGSEHFKRAAVALNVVLLRLIGDRHSVDDRVSEMNYYPLRDARTGAAIQGKRAVSRARILAAAAEQFATHGYEDTPVASIARVAGVSESTVYEQFTTKARLASALWSKQASDMLAAGNPTGVPTRDRLRWHLTGVATFTATHSDHAAPYLSELVCHAPASGDDDLLRRTRDEVADARAAGFLPQTDVSSDDLADLLVAVVISRVLGFPSEGADRAAAWALAATGATASLAS